MLKQYKISTPENSRWTFVQYSSNGSHGHEPRAIYRCVCGNEREVSIRAVNKGKSKSCGCIQKDKAYKLEGRKFGKLTVLRRTECKGVCWDCVCNCGNPKVILATSSQLSSGNKQSCGCSKRGSNNARWTGYEEMTGALLYSFKNEAFERGWEYNVTNEYLWTLFLNQNRKCALTGLPLTFEPNSKNRSRSIRTASLDRIDAEIGYVEGNLQWVHKIVNISKQRMTNDEFLWLCNLIVNFYGANKDEKITNDDIIIASNIQSRMGIGLK